MRSCLIKFNLSNSYWVYALRYVTEFRNVLLHSATKRAPFDILFGKKSIDVRHIRRLGCRAEFCRPLKKLETFSSQTKNVVHLFYEGGVIYPIEISNGTVRTKHVKFIESEFPGSISDSDFDSDYSSSSDTDSDISLTISTTEKSESGDSDDYDDFEWNEEEEDSDSASSKDSEKASEYDVESKNSEHDDIE